MAGAAAALLRSLARRSKPPMQAGHRALPCPNPQAHLFNHGGLLRRHDLLTPMAASPRLFSSSSVGSPTKVTMPPCTEPAPATDASTEAAATAASTEASTNKEGQPMSFSDYIEQKKKLVEYSDNMQSNMQYLVEAEKQIEEKKEELLRLLRQMDADEGSRAALREKCEQEKDHLLRLHLEVEATRKAGPSVDRLVNCVNLFTAVALVYIVATGFH